MPTCSIHQPNFFPWLGYFVKLLKSDTFVFLDDVQFPKKGGTWSNRVQISSNGSPHWLTAPVERDYHGVKPINEVCFSSRHLWRPSIIAKIKESYRLYPHYESTMPYIRDMLNYPSDRVGYFNYSTILHILSLLDLPIPSLHLSSSIITDGTGTHRLISILKALNQDTYLCGAGSTGYLQPDLFQSHNMQLIYHSFTHPVYAQRDKSVFVPGLSIIDAFMSIGISETSNLIGSLL